jgi:alpha-glucosidase
MRQKSNTMPKYFQQSGLLSRGLRRAWLRLAPGRTDAGAAAPEDPWWRHSVIYEIYVRSFQDSNGDGIGDLNGIVQRLDYLESLGVDAIWLTPLYPSPQVDFGYDVSDYRAIDPRYGTLEDFSRVVVEAAKRGLRVVLDMVLNHTSDQHAWFLEAARARDSAWHDFYVWSDGRTDASGKRLPPNNWLSLFGGSAWEYVPAVDQFYYHKYYRQQPDLNWRNPHVERAMFGCMRFWLERGVAGFRLDAVTSLIEDQQLRDEPLIGGTNTHGDPNLDHIHTDNLPETHRVIRRLRSMVDTYPGCRVLIGETYLPRTADLDAWYGGERHNELHLPMDTLVGLGSKLDAVIFRQRLIEAATEIHESQPLLVFDNHDTMRSWDRFGDGVHDLEIARIIAALLLTSRAAVLVYQGQEIGQRTTTPERIEDVRDPMGISGWPREKGRDGERTPMQWDASNPQAGFSTNPHTWLPVPSGYETINVQSELADPESLLNWHRHLIAMRSSYAALRSGRLVMLDRDNPSVLTYARASTDANVMLVSLNMSAQAQTVTLDLAAAGLAGRRLVTLLSSPGAIPDTDVGAAISLPPYAAWVAAVRARRVRASAPGRARRAAARQ